MSNYTIVALLVASGLGAFFIWMIKSAMRAHYATLEPEEEERGEERIEQSSPQIQEPYKITAPAVVAWYLTGGFLADVASPLHNLPAAKNVMTLVLTAAKLPKERKHDGIGPSYLALPSPKVQQAIAARRRVEQETLPEEEEEDEPLEDYYGDDEQEENELPQQSKAPKEITSLVKFVKEGKETEFRAAFIEVMRRIYLRAKDYPSITQANYMYNSKQHDKELAQILLPRSLWNELLSGNGMLRTLGFLVSEDGETRLPKEEDETRLQGATIGKVSSWFNRNYEKIVEFAQNYK